MSCSLYKLIVKDNCYGFEFDISNPLLSINHTEQEVLVLLGISAQLGEGDKIIVLYKRDIIKAQCFAKCNTNEYSYPIHEVNLQDILNTMGDKELEFYYVDGV